MSKRLSVIPAEAVFDDRLRNTDIRVLCALGTFANRDGRCWPATTTIAEKLGVSERHVRTCLRELESSGYLETEHRPGQRSLYLIVREPADPGSIGSGVDPGSRGSGVGPDPGSIGSGTPEAGVPGTPEAGVPPKENTNNTNNQYAFHGRAIRLDEKGFNCWAEAYSHLDLRAELQALDDYYDRELTGAARKKWFQRGSQALNNKNRKAWMERQAGNGEDDSDVIY